MPSAQTEREISKQTKVLLAAGPKGRAVLHDIDMFISGINAYYRKTGKAAAPWTRNDVYALDALKGQFVGEGGGDEARRSMFLSALEKPGEDQGQGVTRLTHRRDDKAATQDVRVIELEPLLADVCPACSR